MSEKPNNLPRRGHRTRFDTPTLEEAILAAQGLTDDIDSQEQIAAMLMRLPEAEVRAAILKSTATARSSARQPIASRTAAGRRTVVVERRAARILNQ
ncbi:hypothetical protein [Microvirga roseola]|uniref:hypothetical protein n=1 Tax=Microvirga roseola TaxID=2883126 RepID=UPI001E42FAA8|nr:hypothetical protein [Microvirga roseola]